MSSEVLTEFKKSKVQQDTVVAYSEKGSAHYEDALNKSFVYGKITTDFVNSIAVSDRDRTLLDIGCGTGFVFDILGGKIKRPGIECIGIDPAIGMLDLAREKYVNEPSFRFLEGSFSNIPMGDKTVDHITSTLALHWVHSLAEAADEMKRVLKNNGAIDILMVAHDDGFKFKRCIVEALKKHLTFGQIMKTAGLVQRVSEQQLREIFGIFNGFEIQIRNPKQIVFGSFAEHMKWWKARSSSVIFDVKNKDRFMIDLEIELNKIATPQGIPFDSSCFMISMKGS